MTTRYRLYYENQAFASVTVRTSRVDHRVDSTHLRVTISTTQIWQPTPRFTCLRLLAQTHLPVAVEKISLRRQTSLTPQHCRLQSAPPLNDHPSPYERPRCKLKERHRLRLNDGIVDQCLHSRLLQNLIDVEQKLVFLLCPTLMLTFP